MHHKQDVILLVLGYVKIPVEALVVMGVLVTAVMDAEQVVLMIVTEFVLLGAEMSALMVVEMDAEQAALPVAVVLVP